MPEGNDQEKTEKATPKRRQDARKKGQLAQSREIPTFFVLMSALFVFFFGGTFMFQKISNLMTIIFQNISYIPIEEPSVSTFLYDIFIQLFIILFPLMISIFAAGVAANLLQIGFLFTLEPLSPKFSKLNPLKGMKKFVSIKSLAESVKSIIKIIFVGGVAFLMLKGEMDKIPSLIQVDIGQTFLFIGEISFKICLYTCLTLIVLSGLDYAFQRWQHEKSLRMTKQEVKDEFKQREGDPAVKARIKSIQREMAQRRMMEAVPEADVVITNPTHLSIALKYDAEQMMAPRLIAKGAGFIAERIREIARANNVVIIEDKPLARTLFKSVEIGGFIPVNLYKAVAEILAYVYRLKTNKSIKV